MTSPMRLGDALEQMALEADVETEIANDARANRLREQWMVDIHRGIDALLKDLRLTGRHERIVTFADEWADVKLDGVHLRWWAAKDRPLGEQYATPMKAAVRHCPNTDCVYPDQEASIWYTSGASLATALRGDIPAHFHESRRCDGVTSDPLPEPAVARDRVIVLRHDEYEMPAALDALISEGYAWTPCCTSDTGVITVIAVLP